MSNSVRFEIPGKPVPWQRAGRVGKRTFDTPRNISAKREIAFAAQDAMRQLPHPFQGAVRLDLVFSWARPRRSNATYKSTRGDIDNYVKLVLDACQGVLFEDDAQVAILYAEKAFFSQPFTSVICTPLEDENGVAP